MKLANPKKPSQRCSAFQNNRADLVSYRRERQTRINHRLGRVHRPFHVRLLWFVCHVRYALAVVSRITLLSIAIMKCDQAGHVTTN
jgi:hypothetical protein